MMRRWMGVALIAGWLSQGMASAQSYAPGPGAARLPEPMPIGGGSPPPNVIPGPITPLQAPPGPGPDLSLPDGHSSAFQTENFVMEKAFYFNFGGVGWERNTMGHLPLAVYDGQNTGTVGNIGRDTGLYPKQYSPVLLDAHDVSEPMEFGPKLTIGYICNEEYAFEVSAWYLFSHTGDAYTIQRGQVDALFTGNPFGFTGDNGLWRQADGMMVTKSELTGNIEGNYRYNNPGIRGFELIMGVRYFDHDETMDVFTNDDGLITGFDPKRVATYETRAHNRLAAVQIGTEYEFMVPYIPWLSVGGVAKWAPGLNFCTTDVSLTRGDGFIGFSNQHNDIQFSQIFETGFFFELHPTERARIRAGYNAMWFLGCTTSEDILDYNLLNTQGKTNTQGSIFWHGPSVEIEFLF